MKKDEERKPVVCVVCKLPIEAVQRPSVRLTNGNEIHSECYNRWQELERLRVN